MTVRFSSSPRPRTEEIAIESLHREVFAHPGFQVLP